MTVLRSVEDQKKAAQLGKKKVNEELRDLLFKAKNDEEDDGRSYLILSYWRGGYISWAGIVKQNLNLLEGLGYKFCRCCDGRCDDLQASEIDVLGGRLIFKHKPEFNINELKISWDK